MSNSNEILELAFLMYPCAVKMHASTNQVEGPIAIFWLMFATQVPAVMH